MNNSIELFIQEARAIHEHFPELIYCENTLEGPCISGELRLRDDQGNEIDRYAIRVVPTNCYPFRFPRVYETGGRVPVNIDWHVFPDGHCCIASIPEEMLLCKQLLTLASFIERQVKPYFFNQKYRELHGYFLHERSHGWRGNVEFFEDILGTRNPVKIAESLNFIKQRSEPERVSLCFCGSQQKYRKCHRSAYRVLRALTDHEIDLCIPIILSC